MGMTFTQETSFHVPCETKFHVLNQTYMDLFPDWAQHHHSMILYLLLVVDLKM